MNDPAASGRVSDKDFYLKAVASVTLDQNGNSFLRYPRFSGARERSERLPRISSPRCGAGYETHWWE
ncbi:MAG: hypothetical protein IID17_15220 [Nitrospinae bacterium]|nr:hypothetical protein [Nitrospinota bacterium]